MAKRTTTKAKANSMHIEPTKDQLQRQMARTRESLAETVGEIKETVSQEVNMVKKGVTGILNYRDEFQNDPLVWSLGALSAGFALGYTVGYAHKNTKGKKQGQMTAFADTMIQQLSGMGQGLVLPALDAKISELFGFEFSAMLEKVGNSQRTPTKERTSKKGGAKRLPAARKPAATRKVTASKKKK
jgi:hypothetical protein